MIKNLTTNQLILIVIATVLLLLAAFSFYLLQNLSAPLPFAPPLGTSSPTPALALTIIATPTALSPTRQTSYTPMAAFITPNGGTPSLPTPLSTTPSPGTTTSPIVMPTTPATTSLTPSVSPSTSPVATGTISPGEVGVTGRMIQNGTPVANVVVEFADDVAPRQSTTSPDGHYWYITLTPGTNFTLTFDQSGNLRLTPTSEVASLAIIEGTLPTGVNVINLPDFEVSINLNGMFFGLQTPADGISYSASAINASNPIQFSWSLYSQAGSYKVQLGPNNSDAPVWSSGQVTSTSLMWNGTLDDGTHITQGSYWWRVSVTKSLGNYIVVVFTHQFDLQFSP